LKHLLHLALDILGKRNFLCTECIELEFHVKFIVFVLLIAAITAFLGPVALEGIVEEVANTILLNT